MFQSFAAPGAGSDTQDRVARIRQQLSADGLDGFLIPRADAHQGEYVAPRDERLAWTTGFTGSAGFAIILDAKAAVFVDGRYTLQARDQVDESLFTIVPIHEVTPSNWLAQSISKNARIGFDPWLHGGAEVKRFKDALAEKSAVLVDVSANVIDRVWDDQPPPPAGAVRAHPEELAGESAESKRKRIAATLSEANADATVLTLPDSIAWLFNIRGQDIPRMPAPLSFAVLKADGTATLFLRPGQADDALSDHLGDGVRVADRGDFADEVSNLSGKSVALDPASCPVAINDLVQKAGGEPITLRDPCILPKATKTAAEIAGARSAHRRDAAAVARFLRWFGDTAPGGDLTEIDIAKRLEDERRATNQLLDLSFDTISGAGPNGAIVHYRVTEATNRRLAPGELMLVDSGGQYRDGTTDITRTMAVGQPSEEAKRAFTLVLKGMIAISTLRFPKGIAGRDIDTLARAALWRAGLDYAHGTGHGVGSYLSVHEGPQRIARTGGEPLLPGMILSNEPGYYKEGAFGIRIENLLVVTEPEPIEGGEIEMHGFETLTLAPIDRNLIDVSILTEEERTWLNAYHARVADEIGPDLSAEDRAWLTEATAPI